MTKRPPDIHVEASIPAHYVRLRCGRGAVIYAHPLAQSCTACVKADRAAHMRNARAIRAKERGHDLMHRDCAAPGCDKSVRIWGNAQRMSRRYCSNACRQKAHRARVSQ
jgi:hypothetical protein